MGYTSVALASLTQFFNLIDAHNTSIVAIDGASLTLASITAVARHNKRGQLSSGCLDRVKKSADQVEAQLKNGGTMYAVNTGIGASAYTRTTAVEQLQQNLIQTLNCGITDQTQLHDIRGSSSTSHTGIHNLLPVHDTDRVNCLPFAWAKAAHLIRVNSLARGISGIRVELLQSLTRVLQEDIVPHIPLRGSISASGDLCPLSYLAGVIQGNPGIQVWTRQGATRVLTTADKALRDARIEPITFAPKEALAIVNGTSVSAAAGALAMHDAHGCMLLAQILTAMNVEGLNGTVESFDPYISDVRPHPGQREAARNIRRFLRGSKLTRKANTENTNGLRQDRYALRTAPQWLGPELENLMLAHDQVQIECNSVTDNPLVKSDGTVVQGGNFQACAVTSAMDKVRSALQTTGRMLFQQSSELMNPSMNNGLPPNLTADEPSCHFLFKGLDIASASYQSELALISHGMMPFVMSAELGNQSINSMALVSARYTHTALNIFMQLSANSLLAACQALDLRAVQYHFEHMLRPKFEAEFTSSLEGLFTGLEKDTDTENLKSLSARTWAIWRGEFYQKSSLDLADRVKASLNVAITSIVLQSSGTRDVSESATLLTGLQNWSRSVETEAVKIYRTTTQQHSMHDTLPLLGSASQKIYQFIRHDLNIPFLRNGVPGPQKAPTFQDTEAGTTVGALASRVYQAIRDGRLFVPVMQCTEEAMEYDMHEDDEVNGEIMPVGKDMLPHKGIKRAYSDLDESEGLERRIKFMLTSEVRQ